MQDTPASSVLGKAFRISVPVLLGYVAIGFGFGLLAVMKGYPGWFAVLMSVVVYAGAAQYIGIGLFAAGASLAEIAGVTLLVNLRHVAYGLSLIGPFAAFPRLRPYLVFALTDETYALFSAVSEEERKDGRFLFFVALLDQSYWVAGTLLGAVTGSLLPWKIEGIGFALTALFIVLMIEQILRVKDPRPFLAAGAATIAAEIIAGPRLAIVSAMVVGVLAMAVLERGRKEIPKC